MGNYIPAIMIIALCLGVGSYTVGRHLRLVLRGVKVNARVTASSSPFRHRGRRPRYFTDIEYLCGGERHKSVLLTDVQYRSDDQIPVLYMPRKPQVVEEGGVRIAGNIIIGLIPLAIGLTLLIYGLIDFFSHRIA